MPIQRISTPYGTAVVDMPDDFDMSQLPPSFKIVPDVGQIDNMPDINPRPPEPESQFTGPKSEAELAGGGKVWLPQDFLDSLPQGAEVLPSEPQQPKGTVRVQIPGAGIAILQVPEGSFENLQDNVIPERAPQHGQPSWWERTTRELERMQRAGGDVLAQVLGGDPIDVGNITAENIPKEDFPNRRSYYEYLQNKFGDPQTVSRLPSSMFEGLPGDQSWSGFDERELDRRKMIAELGFIPPNAAHPNKGISDTYGGPEIPTSINPMVHLGKLMSDTGTGTEQLLQKTGIRSVLDYVLGDWSPSVPGAMDPEEWMHENKMWNAAGHPVAAIALGELAAAAPSLAAAPVRLSMMEGLKKVGNQAIKNAAKREIGRTGFELIGTLPRIPGLSPLMHGMSSGAHAAIQPVNPELSWQDELKARSAAMIGGTAIGTAGSVVGNQVSNALQRRTTNQLLDELQGDLPLRVKSLTPELYDQYHGEKNIKQWAEQPTTFGSAAAKRLEQDARLSLKDNLVAMNKEMTGSTNMKIGESLRPVMEKYRQRYQTSKGRVQAAYDKIDRYGDVYYDIQDYDRFLKDVRSFMYKQGFWSDPKFRGKYDILNPHNVEGMVTDINGHPVLDARHLYGMYQTLNRFLRHTNNKDEEFLLNELKGMLNRYMDASVSTHTVHGNPDAIRQFRRATNMAREHYSKYNGVRQIDKFLEGEENMTVSDLSARMFSNEAINYMEAPKWDIMKKIQSVFRADPYEKSVVNRALKNEVFANLTEDIQNPGGEFSLTMAQSSLPKIQRRLASGEETRMFGDLFSDRELGQFWDLLAAEKGMAQVMTPDLRSFPELIRSPGGRKVLPYMPFGPWTVVRRAEKGRLGTSNTLGKYIAKPGLLEMERAQKEEEARDRPFDLRFLPY